MPETIQSVSNTDPMSRTFERLIERFEEAWRKQPRPNVKDFLPEQLSADERRQALLELVLIDLEYRWKQPSVSKAAQKSSQNSVVVGEFPSCPLLEDYCHQFSELGPCGKLSINAVEHEYRMRLRAGVALDPQEYLQRFPLLSESLTQLFSDYVASDTANTLERTHAEPRAQHSSVSLESPVSLAALRFPVPDFETGQSFGRYRVERTLGQGGMGTVYEVYDTHLHRIVALKIPFFRRGHSPEAVQRFLREARAAAALSHANICRLFDVGMIEGVLFLTMEYIEGETLEAIAKQTGPLPETQVAEIVKQVALGLQDAHDHGIIHRDLKPANILLDKKQQPILMDFGLARHFEGDEAELTRDGDLLGTPAYMSPEQVHGETNELGPATDIYSLGVTMYRLLTGRLPFEGRMSVVLAAIPKNDPPAPRTLNPQISPMMEAICLRAMAKSSGERFVSALKLAEAVAPFAESSLSELTSPESFAVAPSPEPVIANQMKAGRGSGSRTKTIVTLFAAACVLLTLVGFDRFAKDRSATQPPEKVVGGSGGEGTGTGKTGIVSGKDSGGEFVTPAAIADAKLQIHLQRAEQEQDYQVLDNKALPLVKNDKLQLRIKLSGSTYVYVFWIDTDGVCQRLWPENSEFFDRKRQQPLSELWLPPLSSEQTQKNKQDTKQRVNWYELDGSSGLETIIVATSPKPLGQAEVRPIETLRLDLAHFDPNQRALISFRPKDWREAQPKVATLLLPAIGGRDLYALATDQERGIGRIKESIKSVNLPIDDYTKRLSDVFASYTGLVFPHE